MGVEWEPKALKVLLTLDGADRLHYFLKRYEERQGCPRVPDDALHSMRDRYNIKLRSASYRQVFRVEDGRIVILVLTIGKLERGSVFEQLGKR